jgi:heme/copper-type cytochrome/quinol oxidase subunit 1
MFKAHLISIIYFITALVFGAMAWFEQSEWVDIVFNETYIVLPKSVFWLVLTGLFVFFAGIALCFELFRKPMNKYLFATHFLLTIAGLVIIYLSTQQQQDLAPAATSDYSVVDDIQNQPEDTIDWITYAVYMLAGAQIMFVLNVLVSIIKSRRESSRNSH